VREIAFALARRKLRSSVSVDDLRPTASTDFGMTSMLAEVMEKQND
jgi:hypothetical protein